MKMFLLILATLFAILCVVSATTSAFGAVTIFVDIGVPSAVSTVLAFAGFGLCLMLGFLSWIFFSVFGDNATDRDVRLGIGMPITFAGALLMYVGSAPELSWGYVLLTIGMLTAILGTIHCIERIDYLLGFRSTQEFA